MNSQEPPMTVLLGLPFHDLTLEESLAYCARAMKGGGQHYLVTANVDFTTQAEEDPDLRKIVFFADRVVCDGMPLVWLSRMFGYPLRERVAGSDMVPRLLEICGREKYGVYFFGSDLDTLVEAKGIVEARYPGLRVVGVDSPPMGAVVEWDNDALCERMRASGAQLLLVCLGCPKQERWIFAHHQATGIPLSIGVGASLDFITGKQKRAPRWMQKTGMEWLWRMSGNPSRLVARYRKDLVFLVRAAFRQWWAQCRREIITEVAEETPVEEPVHDLAVTRISWSGTLQQSGLTGAPVPDAVDSPVVLDVSRVSFLDSSGLGRLAQLLRVCRSSGQLLVVVRPTEVFRHAVRAAQMDVLFPTVEDEAEAVDWIRRHGSASAAGRREKDGVVWVSFHRALDALYYDEMMEIIDSAVRANPGMKSMVIDLRGVGFIDSRAVGGLIRAWKTVGAGGGSLHLSGATPQVREIIALLRLDKILPEWKGEPPA